MPIPSREKLQAANQASLQQDDRVAEDAAAQPCPLLEMRQAIEAVVVGEDDQLRAGETVQLQNDQGQTLRTITNKDGIARFGGLDPGSYQMSLCDLDSDAWEGTDNNALPTDRVQSQEVANWTPANDAQQRSFTHRVVQGDCIANIAEKYGLLPDTVWNAPENADLKETRIDGHILMPEEDCVYVPAKRFKSEPATTGNRYSLKRKGVPQIFRILFVDDFDEPRAQLTYLIKLETAKGEVIKDTTGKTDDDGYLIEAIPPDSVVAKVTLDPGIAQEEYEIRLGHVDPIDEYNEKERALSLEN